MNGYTSSCSNIEKKRKGTSLLGIQRLVLFLLEGRSMEENSSSKKLRREDLEEPEIYEALRQVVFQNEKCSLKNRGIISRERFQDIVFRINSEIEMINADVPESGRIAYLNQQCLLRRFERIKNRVERDAFRKKYGCLDCIYYEKPRICVATKHCPLEDDAEPEKQAQILKHRCPKDQIGNCPFGNAVGTCFGFCWQEILSEHRERKRRNEQIKEEKADG